MTVPNKSEIGESAGEEMVAAATYAEGNIHVAGLTKSTGSHASMSSEKVVEGEVADVVIEEISARDARSFEKRPGGIHIKTMVAVAIVGAVLFILLTLPSKVFSADLTGRDAVQSKQQDAFKLTNQELQSKINKAIKDFTESNSSNKYTAAWDLRAIGEPAIEPIGKLLIHSERFVRSEAAEVLAYIATEDTSLVSKISQYFLDALRHGDKNIRRSAIEKLRYEPFDLPEIVSAVEALTNDKDRSTRDAANKFLRGKALTELQRKLEKNEKAKTSLTAEETEERVKDLLAIMVLSQRSGDRNSYGYKAKKKLVTIGGPAVREVAKLLRDSDSSVRFNATSILADIARNNKSLVPEISQHFIDAFQDDDSGIRYSAISSLNYATFHSPEIVSAVEARRNDPEKSVRNAANDFLDEKDLAELDEKEKIKPLTKKERQRQVSILISKLFDELQSYSFTSGRGLKIPVRLINIGEPALEQVAELLTHSVSRSVLSGGLSGA